MPVLEQIRADRADVEAQVQSLLRPEPPVPQEVAVKVEVVDLDKAPDPEALRRLRARLGVSLRAVVEAGLSRPSSARLTFSSPPPLRSDPLLRSIPRLYDFQMSPALPASLL